MKSVKKQFEQINFKEKELHKSAGILDDYAIRKTINCTEGYFSKWIKTGWVYPLITATYDIGSNLLRYKDIYLSGNISAVGLGANTITCDVIKPVTDGTAGLQITKADGITPMVIFDQTNMETQISGAFLIGSTTLRSIGGGTRTFQLESTGTAPLASIAVIKNSNDIYGGTLYFGKSRGTVLGSNTIIQSGDILGALVFCGANGSSLASASAAIYSNIDATPGAADLPGRLSFWTTPDGSTTLAERMRVDNAGHVFVYSIRSGATQAASGAAASELWKTSGHASLPDNVVMIGV